MDQTPMPATGPLVGLMLVRVNSAGVLVTDMVRPAGHESPPPAAGPAVLLRSLPRRSRGHDSRATALVSAGDVDWAESRGEWFRAPAEATQLLALVPARRGVRVGWLIAWIAVSALLALAWSHAPSTWLRHLVTGSVLITLLVLWMIAQDVKGRRRSRSGRRALPRAVARYYPGLPIYPSLPEAAAHYPVATRERISDLARQSRPAPQVDR